MTNKNIKTLRNNKRQLALIVLGFVMAISLLEARGFIVWLNRLEPGPTQQVVLKGMEKLEDTWRLVAASVVEFREKALDYLAEHGWSDMPKPASSTESAALTGTADMSEPADVIPSTKHSNDVLEETPSNIKSRDVENDEDAESTEDIKKPEGDQDHAEESKDHGLPFLINPLQEKTLPEKGVATGKLTPLPALKTGQIRHVALAGDSMMSVGLAPQLQRELSEYKDTVSTVKAYRPATGLARPDVFDWQKEYPLMVGNDAPDVVIVSIGGNDTQNLSVDGQVLTLGSAEWKVVYEQRLQDYLNMLTKDGATVLWIKLPPMRPGKYNRSIEIVNEVAHKVISESPYAIWWDVSDRFLSAEGNFLEFSQLPSGSRQVRIRQADGIHLTDDGAKLLSSDIMMWLNLDAPSEDDHSATEPSNAAEKAPGSVEISTVF